MKIEKGDRIKFRAITRWSAAAVWRVVNGFWDDAEKQPTVRYGGWPDFVVEPHEILEIEKRPTEAK